MTDLEFTHPLVLATEFTPSLPALMNELLIVHKSWAMCPSRVGATKRIESKFWRAQSDDMWRHYTINMDEYLLDVCEGVTVELDWSGPEFQAGPDDYDYDWGTYTHKFNDNARAINWAVLTMYDMWLDGYKSADVKITLDNSRVVRMRLEDFRDLWDNFETQRPSWETV